MHCLIGPLGLRCEWAKSKARADRWSEEVTLLVEEMRRVIEYLDYKARWWDTLASARNNISAELREGLSAYSAKQSAIRRSMAASFATKWYSLLVTEQFTVDWPQIYIPK